MIQVKAMQRLFKESKSYEKEMDKETKKLFDLEQAEQPDEYKLRNQRTMVEELNQVLPEVQTKFLRQFEKVEGLI